MLEAILALDAKNGLAKNGEIPWKCKKDLIFFKNTTLNNVVIMGSKTFLSLPNSLPLTNRINIVLTKNPASYKLKYLKYDNVIFLNIEELERFLINPSNLFTKDQLKFLNKDFKMFVIGGNELYNMLFPYCKIVWMSTVKMDYNCDLIVNYKFEDFKNKEIIYDDDELSIIKMSR